MKYGSTLVTTLSSGTRVRETSSSCACVPHSQGQACSACCWLSQTVLAVLSIKAQLQLQQTAFENLAKQLQQTAFENSALNYEHQIAHPRSPETVYMPPAHNLRNCHKHCPDPCLLSTAKQLQQPEFENSVGNSPCGKKKSQICCSVGCKTIHS
jgi:hypothetical protein